MAHSEDIVPHAHNEFLEILSETGLAGFLGFAVVVCLCVYGARKKMKSSPPSERIVTGSYVAALAAILVDNLASMNLRTAPVAAGFWILLALAGGPAAPSKKESGLSLPPWVKSLRLLPYAALGALLVWYIPRVAGRYRAQQSYLAGNLLRYQNRSAESSIRFAEALSDDNELAEARLYLAANLAAESRFEEARNNIDTLLSQNPYYPKARFILAVSRAGLHDTAGAVLALNEEIQIENSPQTVYFASYYQRRMGHTEEEFALVKLLLRNAVRSGSPEFVKEGVGRMTELCGEQAKREECAGIVAETRLSFPQDVPILFAAEDYYERMGLLRDAEETLSQVRALSPDDPGVKERAARLDDLRRPGN
jgi:tetratricopeptide (TPR) repeat protein